MTDTVTEQPDARERACVVRLDRILSDYAILRAFAVQALPSAEVPCTCPLNWPSSCLRCQTAAIVGVAS